MVAQAVEEDKIQRKTLLAQGKKPSQFFGSFHTGTSIRSIKRLILTLEVLEKKADQSVKDLTAPGLDQSAIVASGGVVVDGVAPVSLLLSRLLF